MSEKRNAEIIDAVLRKVSHVIYNTYIDPNDSEYQGINPDTIYNTIQDIPDTLRCTHIFTKGKRKDNVCNVVLCTHHEKPELKDVTDEVLAKVLNDSLLVSNVEQSKRDLGIHIKTV